MRNLSSNVKRITMIGMFSAIAFALVTFGRIPVVLFLKYDPKDIIIALGGFIMGPLASLLISVIVSFIEMITISDTGIIGCIMNILSTCSFACVASIIYYRKKTIKGAIIGLVTGCVAMVIIMIAWNYLITPLYMKIPRQQVAELLIPAFLPFNVLKGGLNAAFTFLLYKPIIGALRKSGLVSTGKGETASSTASEGSKKIGYLGIKIGALLVIAGCIIWILVLRGII
ncbi:MAG: ECF transporter S component [Lachnospiraceae bacterium]|nr:ECF transporter S component [Lachnospiraceae bacterium]